MAPFEFGEQRLHLRPLAASRLRPCALYPESRSTGDTLNLRFAERGTVRLNATCVRTATRIDGAALVYWLCGIERNILEVRIAHWRRQSSG
jgi:hypothetical protein